MSVTSVEKDFDELSLTLTADFDAPLERVWELWSDPRKLERWWGPPEYPATFSRHDLKPGGEMAYFMTGPQGDKHHGWWKVTEVKPPTWIEFDEGFAYESGTPNDSLPQTRCTMRLVEHDGGTRMELQSFFDTREQMEELDKMGMTEGLSGAVGQMDAILAE
jgi:uncharacterized protein YndB with AHSA1/START domain